MPFGGMGGLGLHSCACATLPWAISSACLPAIVCVISAGLGRERFLAWAAWCCVWAAAMIVVLALTNACVVSSSWRLGEMHASSKPFQQ